MTKVIAARPPFQYLTRFEAMAKFANQFATHKKHYWRHAFKQEHPHPRFPPALCCSGLGRRRPTTG